MKEESRLRESNQEALAIDYALDNMNGDMYGNGSHLSIYIIVPKNLILINDCTMS